MKNVNGENIILSRIKEIAKKNNCKTIFPFGTHFYREPSRPMKELKRDMRIVKRLGFNMIKMQESWCIDEKREGEINLEKIEELIEEAEKLDLYIYFGVTMEQAPAWLWKKYPDCRMVYSTGEKHEDPTQYLLPPSSFSTPRRFCSFPHRKAAWRNRPSPSTYHECRPLSHRTSQISKRIWRIGSPPRGA